MTSGVGKAIVLAAGIVLGTAPAADAQVQVNSSAASITLTGRVHLQFNTSSASGEPQTEFLMRRVRFTADVRINDFVSGRVQPDYGEGTIQLRDAYVRLTFSPQFQMTFGQFKRPFDVFELVSSTEMLVVERAGGVRGVSACAGVGGVCSFSRLTEKLQFSDRDIGVMVEGSSGNTGYQLSVTNGTGANAKDENGAKSYTGRVKVAASDNVQIAANLGLHDYVNAVSLSDDLAVAAGADLEIGSYDEGLHIQAGLAAGQNWANLDVGGDPSTFMTAQGILTFRNPVANSAYVSAIEPVGRISWADPDTDLGDDDGLLLTPGFVVHFVGRNKVGANIDFWIPADGDPEWSFKFQSYLHF